MTPARVVESTGAEGDPSGDESRGRDERGERPRRSERGGRTPDGRAIPAELGALEAGDVLWDRHRRECFQVGGIDAAGISLRQDGIRYYVPHSLFVPWYGSRLFPIAETTSTDLPEWCMDDVR